MSNPVVIDGYLTEPKPASALRATLGAEWLGTQFSSGTTRHRWDVAFRRGDSITVVGAPVQAMVDNTRAVHLATLNVTRSNAGRREGVSLPLSTGLLKAKAGAV